MWRARCWLILSRTTSLTLPRRPFAMRCAAIISTSSAGRHTFWHFGRSSCLKIDDSDSVPLAQHHTGDIRPICQPAEGNRTTVGPLLMRWTAPARRHPRAKLWLLMRARECLLLAISGPPGKPPRASASDAIAIMPSPIRS